MKNLNLDFIDDNIKYDEYYFNGLSIPKDIKITDINSSIVIFMKLNSKKNYIYYINEI